MSSHSVWLIVTRSSDYKLTVRSPNYWAGNSSYGAVFMIINTSNETADIAFDLTENWAIRAGRQYHVRDMWAHANCGVAVR